MNRSYILPALALAGAATLATSAGARQILGRAPQPGRHRPAPPHEARQHPRQQFRPDAL